MDSVAGAEVDVDQSQGDMQEHVGDDPGRMEYRIDCRDSEESPTNQACCCAPGCSANTYRGLKFFGFPKCSARRRQWELKVKRKNLKPNDNSKVCQDVT